MHHLHDRHNILVLEGLVGHVDAAVLAAGYSSLLHSVRLQHWQASGSMAAAASC